MGAAKSNPVAITTKGLGRFDPSYQSEAERDRSLHHALAFERVTGWPIHGTYVGDEAIRFHNEGPSHWIFDVRGIISAAQHSQWVTQPIVMARRDWPPSAINSEGYLEIGCTCMGAGGVSERGITIDLDQIAKAEAIIRKNQAYLALVPTRPLPHYPAATLRRYAFGRCVVFAEALSRIRGLPAVTLVPEALADWAEVRPDQMQHAAVLHPDGELEDVWGKYPTASIAERYGFARWRLSEDAHRAMIEDGIAERPAVRDEIAEAETVIRDQLALGQTS